MTPEINDLLSAIEPEAVVFRDLPSHDLVAKYSTAISLKRIADAIEAYVGEFNKGWTEAPPAKREGTTETSK